MNYMVMYALGAIVGFMVGVAFVRETEVYPLKEAASAHAPESTQEAA